MNWDDMRIFLSVAREESLTGAAKVLRLDPATIGRRIARLERDMNAVLFAKSPQGYVLTDAGEVLSARAEVGEQAFNSAVSDLGGQDQTLSGTIRVGAPDGCASYLLPPVIHKITQENPSLTVHIVALPRVFNLSKREADMAIAVSRPRAGRLTVQKISNYRLQLAASGGYLDQNGPITTREALKSHPVIGYIPDMIFDRELDYLAELGLEAPQLASNLVSVQLGLLRAGAGVGVVHDFAMPDTPDLKLVLPDELSLGRTFWLIRHVDDARVERLNRFARVLTDGLRAELARRRRA